MALGNLTTNLLAQIDNPDCSYLVGMTIGESLAFRGLIIILIIVFIMKAADKLAIDPFIEWARKKIYGGKNKNV